MKNKDYRMAQTKYKLKELKERKVKSVIWRLTRNQKEYIERLGYKVIPYLYEVKTRSFNKVSDLKNPKLKDLHYANKKGKKAIVLNLKDSDMKEFKEFGVNFRPIKYKIYLIS